MLVCARGKRGYLIQNKLKALGFTGTRVLEGGATFNVIKRALPEGGKLPADEIKRVKGLGCLQDKRFPDVFNVRVITRNGKITVAEHYAVAEGAERFGSGEVAMTSRLTMEIQGVKYENIDALIAFLAEHGLETGGTGSLVRPVVSCKGTTCQYGLIDTFDLSEKIHERFYKGYHDVTLPHKFKIAVGGCPNNCVKPDLNDLGIIGQRLPMFVSSKCRGCKVCQVENACPIKVATMENGKLVVNPDAWQRLRAAVRENVPSVLPRNTPTALKSTSAVVGVRKWQTGSCFPKFLPVRKRCWIPLSVRSCSSAMMVSPVSVLLIPLPVLALNMSRINYSTPRSIELKYSPKR